MSDEILTYIKNTVDRIETKQDDHANRLVGIERWQSNADGKMTMLAIVGACLGAIGTWLSEIFRGHS